MLGNRSFELTSPKICCHSIRQWVLCIAMAGTIITGAAPVAAHGTFEERSEIVNEELSENPDDARLHLKRGDLLRQDERYQEALVEYEKARKLRSDLIEIELALGLLFADWKQPKRALHHLDHFLDHRPRHVHARIVRAECLEALDRIKEAAQEVHLAVSQSERLTPDLILAEVRLLRMLGEFEKAIDLLNLGHQRLGNVAVLDQAAVDVDIERGEIKSALGRLDLLAKTTPPRERWLVRKATLLEGAGRIDEARATWLAAKKAIDARPGHRRAVPALQTLSETIDTALERLRKHH